MQAQSIISKKNVLTRNDKTESDFSQKTTWRNPIKYTKFTSNLCKCIDIAKIIIFMNVSIRFGFQMRNITLTSLQTDETERERKSEREKKMWRRERSHHKNIQMNMPNSSKHTRQVFSYINLCPEKDNPVIQ